MRLAMAYVVQVGRQTEQLYHRRLVVAKFIIVSRYGIDRLVEDLI